MADHEYVPDQLFSEAREVIDFFLHDVAFRTDSKMKANITGKNGIVFRGQSDAKWDLIPTVFRAGDSLVQFTPQPPPVCAGATATITATPGAAGTYSYAWTVPAVYRLRVMWLPLLLPLQELIPLSLPIQLLTALHYRQAEL